jgi:hypothetical protein
LRHVIWSNCNQSTPKASENTSSPESQEHDQNKSDAEHTPESQSTNSDGKAQGTTDARPRFSKHARSTLKVWFHEHREHPYPSQEEKDNLQRQTGLNHGQIAMWLANQRRRDRRRQSQNAAAVSGPVDDTNFQSLAALLSRPAELEATPVDLLDPMERFKYIPQDFEVDMRTDITNAVASTASAHGNAMSASVDPFNDAWSEMQEKSSVYSGRLSHAMWAPSIVSYETGITSQMSDTYSINDPLYRCSSKTNIAHLQRRRRQRRPASTKTQSIPDISNRRFQCTFCLDCTFATKYDWQRHEKSQHLNLERWICCPTGGRTSTPQGEVCAFCNHANPDTAHLETHHYSECQGKEEHERTFFRKDHFVQHLRLTHSCKFVSSMSAWKTETADITSRCGFCESTFCSWTERADHVAAHFKAGAIMKDWFGDRGFAPEVEALVNGAVPLFDPSKLMLGPGNSICEDVTWGGGGDNPLFSDQAFISGDIISGDILCGTDISTTLAPAGLDPLWGASMVDWTHADR